MTQLLTRGCYSHDLAANFGCHPNVRSSGQATQIRAELFLFPQLALTAIHLVGSGVRLCVLMAVVGCSNSIENALVSVDDDLGFEGHAISPTEEVIWLRENNRRFIKISPGSLGFTCVPYSTNIPVDKVISIFEDFVVGRFEEQLILGRQDNRKLVFNQSIATPREAESVQLIKLDNYRFCELQEYFDSGSYSKLRCFSVQESSSSIAESEFIIRQFAALDLGGMPNPMARALATSYNNHLIVSRVWRPVVICKIGQNNELLRIATLSDNNESIVEYSKGEELATYFTTWVDISPDGKWIVFSRHELKQGPYTPVRIVLNLARMEIRNSLMEVGNQIKFEQAINEPFGESMVFARAPVRFLDSGSFIVASSIGWAVVGFNEEDDEIVMDEVVWREYPQLGYVPHCQFSGFWRNSLNGETFVIRSEVAGEAALIKLDSSSEIDPPSEQSER